MPNVLYAKPYHCKPVNSDSPCKHGLFNPERKSKFRPEDSASPKFNPYKGGMLYLELAARLCKGKIARDKPYFFSSRKFDCKLLEHSEQFPEIHCFVNDYSFHLVEFNQMRCIYNIRPVTARNSKIFSWNFNAFDKLPC